MALKKLKNEIDNAKNRFRGSVNIIKKKQGLKKTAQELDAFNNRTRGLRKKGLGVEDLNMRNSKPLELFKKKGGK